MVNAGPVGDASGESKRGDVPLLANIVTNEILAEHSRDQRAVNKDEAVTGSGPRPL